MKSKTKKLVVLSFAAALCGALATGAMIASPQDVSASTAPTFKMADGASIRYTKVGDKKEGLRFMVLADETTKNAIVESGKFGVIISTAADFANVDESADYLSQLDDMDYETNKEVTDSAAIEEMFYEGEKEYAGYWCANIVINMSSNADYDTVEDFTERTYSAVAYYPTGDDTYAYTENRQERSIQEVASSLYLQGDEKWAKVKETYPTIGTETTPILVAQNGKNAYKTLIEKVNASSDFGAGYYFELTENVLVEKVLSEDASFQGTFVGTYTATEPVGMIYDAKNATAFNATAKILDVTTENVTVTKAFSENEKFDANSNGSAKITVTAGDEDISNVYFSVSPAFSEAYYNELISEGGYTHMLVRYKIEKSSFVGAGFGWVTDLSGATEYSQDGTLLTKPNDWFEKAYKSDTWLERAIPVSNYNGIISTFVRINVFKANASVTLYIDNIYLAKAAASYTNELREVAEGTVVNVQTDFSSELDVDGAYNEATSYTANGATVVPENGQLTLAGGVYVATYHAYNRLVAKRTYAAYDAKPQLWSYVTDTTLSNISSTAFYANNTSTPSATATATLSADEANGVAKVTHSAEGGYSDLYIKPVQNKAYYEGLKLVGYKYVTIPLIFHGGQFKLAAIGASGSNEIHYNNVYDGLTSGLVTVEKGQDGTLTETAFVGKAPWANGGTKYTVSFSIDFFINNYNAESMKLLRLFTVWANGTVYGVYDFSSIQFTKDGQIS